MNRSLPVLTLFGALVGTATAAPYVLPSPQPGALTPYDWQPVYAIEGLYSFADKGSMPDSWGVRGSFNLYDSGIGTFRHQFDINVAATWGNESVHLGDYTPLTAYLHPEQRTRFDLFLLPVTAGYNLNIELLDNIMLYLGAKAGYAWSHGKLKVTGKTADGNDFSFAHSRDAGGFTFSVGGGLKVQCSERLYAHAGYEFGRSYLDYNFGGKDINYGTHTIFLGIGTQF